MKKADFEQAIRQTPLVMARFKLTRPNAFMLHEGCEKGDMFLFHPNGCMIPEKGGMSRADNCSMYEFAGYVYVNENPYKNKWTVIGPAEAPQIVNEPIA